MKHVAADILQTQLNDIQYVLVVFEWVYFSIVAFSLKLAKAEKWEQDFSYHPNF